MWEGTQGPLKGDHQLDAFGSFHFSFPASLAPIVAGASAPSPRAGRRLLLIGWHGDELQLEVRGRQHRTLLGLADQVPDPENRKDGEQRTSFLELGWLIWGQHSEIQPASLQLVVRSPVVWGLRTYLRPCPSSDTIPSTDQFT